MARNYLLEQNNWGKKIPAGAGIDTGDENYY